MLFLGLDENRRDSIPALPELDRGEVEFRSRLNRPDTQVQDQYRLRLVGKFSYSAMGSIVQFDRYQDSWPDHPFG